MACAATLFALSAGSGAGLADAFPILSRPGTGVPATLLGFLQGDGPTLSDARIDLRHARPIRTPLGTGYVLTDRRADLICVAAPGFDRGTWGAACGSAAAARQSGAGGLESFGPLHVASYVAVLPTGARASAGPVGARATPLPLPDGVLAIVVHRPTVITTRIAGRITRTVLRGPYTSARVAVPPRAAVARAVRFRILPGRVPQIRIGFHAGHAVHGGQSAYVLETSPLAPRSPGCDQGDSILQQTAGDIAAGQSVQLHGGAPTCAGRWRVTVYYAASNGSRRYPGTAWAQPLLGATTPPPGSGDQIVSTQVITVR